MKTMTVGEFKSGFSAALEAVQAGETIVVCYGRSRSKVAALVPYDTIRPTGKRPLGLLKDKASVRFASDFAMDDTALLQA